MFPTLNIHPSTRKTCWQTDQLIRANSTTYGEGLGVKINQMIWIIHQNNRFRPKCYPLFRFRPKFRLNNWFRHSRGRNRISNFGFRLNRNRNQKLIFGFGSGCFKSNFGCSLRTPNFGTIWTLFIDVYMVLLLSWNTNTQQL